jgi:hypothetical protein
MASNFFRQAFRKYSGSSQFMKMSPAKFGQWAVPAGIGAAWFIWPALDREWLIEMGLAKEKDLHIKAVEEAREKRMEEKKKSSGKGDDDEEEEEEESEEEEEASEEPQDDEESGGDDDSGDDEEEEGGEEEAGGDDDAEEEEGGGGDDEGESGDDEEEEDDVRKKIGLFELLTAYTMELKLTKIRLPDQSFAPSGRRLGRIENYSTSSA